MTYATTTGHAEGAESFTQAQQIAPEGVQVVGRIVEEIPVTEQRILAIQADAQRN